MFYKRQGEIQISARICVVHELYKYRSIDLRHYLHLVALVMEFLLGFMLLISYFGGVREVLETTCILKLIAPVLDFLENGDFFLNSWKKSLDIFVWTLLFCCYRYRMECVHIWTNENLQLTHLASIFTNILA